ncbi:MAG: FAD-dependent oxidoreductase [Actinomycetota bacterium]
MRIGVFICYCGSNIAANVDVEKVAQEAQKFPGVVFTQTNLYTCSEPGQLQIVKAVKENNLNRVVVASCSPQVHNTTFMRTVESAGLNPYLFNMANIREQDSWIHDDRQKATEKAVDLVRMAVGKVYRQGELYPKYFDINKTVMVIGGGITGIQTALDIANGGRKVILVEKEASIGGMMAQLDKTFPTIDCSACILSPKMVDVGTHENIELLTNSEVVKLEGSVGNFTATIRKKPRYIDIKNCTSCAECEKVCPVTIPNKYEAGMAQRKAISKMFAQAVPSAYSIQKRGKAPCRSSCPADVAAQGYIALIREGKYLEALKLHREDNPFPSICGRVCTHPCESNCTRKLVDDPIAIMSLKRFMADYERKMGQVPLPQMEDKKPQKVAVVGSGPAGLTAAYYLAKKGYGVKVFEALPVVGGMLRTEIPDYRLPQDILEAEIEVITRMGVDIATESKIENTGQLWELRDQYDAVFLATGAHRDMTINIGEEDVEGVISGVEFLKDVSLKKADQLKGKVGVIGGGNVAIDSARSALRLGSDQVSIFYRRSQKEMPAIEEEYEDAVQEGVKVNFLTTPVRIIEEDGRLKGVEFIKNRLGEPDASGRRKFIPIEGSEFTVELDWLILAIGQRPDTDYLVTGNDKLKLTRWNSIELENEDILLADSRGIFAGGDVVTGPATVTEAIGHGKLAARVIDRYIGGEDLQDIARDVAEEKKSQKRLAAEEVFSDKELKSFKKEARLAIEKLDSGERIGGFEEVLGTISEEEAKKEAERCLNCGICSECEQCITACEANCIDYSQKEELIEKDIGAIAVTVGVNVLESDVFGEYGGGELEDVITSLQYERLMCASGPTHGHILRPSDNKEPKKVVFLSCVGSRDRSRGLEYCSSACCMYLAKQSILTKEHIRDSQSYLFYTDIRSPGKDYDEFIDRAKQYGTKYIRGRVSKVYKREKDGKLIVKGVDTILNQMVEIEADLVVLATAMVADKNAAELAKILNISTGPFGFFKESHPKLRPVETNTNGVYIAGTCQSPKDIPSSVAQGSAAASKILALMSVDKLASDPMVAKVDQVRCIGCNKCLMVCPFNAIEEVEVRGRKVVNVIETVCKGCGLCEATCPIDSISLSGFTDEMIIEEIKAFSK